MAYLREYRVFFLFFLTFILNCLGFWGNTHAEKNEVKKLSEWKWEWFSDMSRAFAPLKADPREAVFRFGFLYDDNNGWMEDACLGGDLGLILATKQGGHKFTLTARGLFSARFDVFSESFDLQNTDFIGGLALGNQIGSYSWEFFAYHQSSHLGDEILERGQRQRIDYGRETLRILGSYQWNKCRFYGGPSFTLHANPKAIQYKWILQTGAQVNFSLWDWPAYAALDLQSRQEHDWSVNSNAQVGIGLGGRQKKMNRQWVFIEFFHGYSNMGQFYDELETFGLIGVSYFFR